MIRGFQHNYRPPWLGNIKLGVKGSNGEPVETDHFVVPEDVAKVYGENPRALDIVVSHPSPDETFQLRYMRYVRNAGCVCRGDGESASERSAEKKAWVRKACPCDHLEAGRCKLVGVFKFMIPRVSTQGVFHIATPSKQARRDILDKLEHIRRVAGRFDMVPLRILRVPKKMPGKNGMLQTHYSVEVVMSEAFEREVADRMLGTGGNGNGARETVQAQAAAAAVPLESAANVPGGDDGSPPLPVDGTGTKPEDTMPEAQRNHILQLMAQSGVSTEEERQALFRFAIGNAAPDVAAGNRFIKHFATILDLWRRNQK